MAHGLEDAAAPIVADYAKRIDDSQRRAMLTPDGAIRPHRLLVPVDETVLVQHARCARDILAVGWAPADGWSIAAAIGRLAISPLERAVAEVVLSALEAGHITDADAVWMQRFSGQATVGAVRAWELRPERTREEVLALMDSAIALAARRTETERAN